MADTKTAADWKASADALEKQRSELNKQDIALYEQQQDLQKSILGYNRIINSISSTPEQKAQAQQQKAAAQAQISDLKNQSAQLQEQQDKLLAEKNQALNNSKTAETAPPDTSKNTPPANPDPGPNTEPKPTSPAVPPTDPTEVPPDEFGNLEAAQERARNSGDVILSEDGEVATGIRRNPETGETFYTDPPPPDPNEYPDTEFGNLDQAIRDQQAPDEFGDLDAAIAEQEGTGLKEPPVMSEEEAEQYLRDQPPADYGNNPDSDNVDSGTKEARNSATPLNKIPDWRFRVQLARSADYLYKAQSAGILAPLKGTDGVLFPYTPTINVSYNANYEIADLPHSNFKVYNYRNSSVENISVTGEFTAQDTYEANYVLAVIHFFRSVTKMFYGQDANPPRGLPPPLCYLSGHGDYAFNYHPVLITNFTMSYPNDVDYITATLTDSGEGQTGQPSNLPVYVAPSVAMPTPLQRLNQAKLAPGGYARAAPSTKSNETASTRIPTRLSITFNAVPVVTRNDYSNRFSLKDYATGKLMKGNESKSGGIW